MQEELGKHKGYEYARTQNPTRLALEAEHRRDRGRQGGVRVRLRHGGDRRDHDACCKSGDHVVVTDNTYGGTFRLFDKVLTQVRARRSATSTRRSPSCIEQAITPEHEDAVRRNADQPGAAPHRSRGRRRRSRSAHGVRLVVDNTFASPCLQRPIELGADLVMHSTTKYLNGHSDSIGGVVIAARDEDIEWLKFIQNAAGAILSPFDSWLVLRGTKTLAVRMAQHNRERAGARRVPGSRTRR